MIKNLILICMIMPLMASCIFDRCTRDARHWIAEAPDALDEFLAVKTEILNNQQFVDSFTIQGVLFIHGANHLQPERYPEFNMPKLKKWLHDGRGYISFGENDTSACYRACERGRISTSAYLRITREEKYSSAVRIIDSTKLRDPWFAEVVRCKGCGS